MNKFFQHSWYFSGETVILLLFDNKVHEQTKMNMVVNSRSEKVDFEKTYIPRTEKLASFMYLHMVGRVRFLIDYIQVK